MMVKFCPQCGNEMVKRQIKGRQRQTCPCCGYVHWNVEKISVGGIVTREDRILLVQRANNPGKGRWTIPGGFVEQTETLPAAIEREIAEETGITTTAKKIVVIGELPNPKQHDIYLTFQLDYCHGQIKKQQEEVLNAGFFSIEEAKKLPLADLTRQLLTHYSGDKLGFKQSKIAPQQANGFYLYM